MAVLKIGIMQARDFLPMHAKYHPKVSFIIIYFVTFWQDWLGIAKLKNIFTLTISPSTKLQNFIPEFFTD